MCGSTNPVFDRRQKPAFLFNGTLESETFLSQRFRSGNPIYPSRRKTRDFRRIVWIGFLDLIFIPVFEAQRISLSTPRKTRSNHTTLNPLRCWVEFSAAAPAAAAAVHSAALPRACEQGSDQSFKIFSPVLLQ